MPFLNKMSRFRRNHQFFYPGYFGRFNSLKYSYLLLGSVFALSLPARADFFLHSWEGHYEKKSFLNLRLEGNYYFTTSNFDATGAVSSPSTLHGYTRIQPDLTLAFGVTERISLFGRVSWAYVSQNSDFHPGNGFGFTDQTVGADYRIYQHPVRSFNFLPSTMDIQIQGDIPTYNNSLSETASTPYLGDGTLDLTAGLFSRFPFYTDSNGSFDGILGGGYTYRTGGFSAAIPWSLNLQYTPELEGFLFSLGAFGMTSLRTDPNGLNATSTRSTTGSGGSFFTGDTNSSLLQLRARVGYRIEDGTDFFLTVTQSVWGQAAPNGLLLTLGLQVRFGKYQKSNPLFQSAESYDHSNRGFLSYSLEARILKANDRLNLVKIDKGSQDGVELKQIFDVFLAKKDGSVGEAIARGQVSSVKVDQAALEITEYYKEVWIEEGFIAKRLIE